MPISLTQKKKKASIKQLGHEVLQEEFLIIRKNRRQLGKFTSRFCAVCFGPLHFRSLERDKTLSLIFAKEVLTKTEKMKVSQTGDVDISWWINNIKDTFSPIPIPNCSFLLKTDVSKSGLGAIFDKEVNCGHFVLDESLFHINVLELFCLDLTVYVTI